MWYRKFAIILLFICLVAADSAGVQKILQISKEKGTVTEYKDPYPKIKKEVAYFPVAESKWDDRKTVAYGDSFMMERTYGGKRGHEGWDVMASYSDCPRADGGLAYAVKVVSIITMHTCPII